MFDAAAGLFRSLDRELWVITSRDENCSSGLIATSVSQASILETRPRLMVGLAKQHLTGELVERSGVFVAHLIEATQHEWVRHFGTHSGRNVDKFFNIKTEEGVTGAPILSESHAWLECRIEASLDSGDRWWYLAEIVDARWSAGFIPFTVQQLMTDADDDFRKLLRQQLVADSLTDEQLIADWKPRSSG